MACTCTIGVSFSRSQRVLSRAGLLDSKGQYFPSRSQYLVRARLGQLLSYLFLFFMISKRSRIQLHYMTIGYRVADRYLRALAQSISTHRRAMTENRCTRSVGHKKPNEDGSMETANQETSCQIVTDIQGPCSLSECHLIFLDSQAST